MENILFINPPSGFLIDERVFLPLGLASIVAVARNEGYGVKLLDLVSNEDYKKRVLDELDNKKYEALGITATSPQFYYAYDILQSIKKSKHSSVKTIIGGAHASMFSAFRKQLISKFTAQGFKEKALEEKLYNEDPNFKKLEEFKVIAEGEEGSFLAAINSNEHKWVNGGIVKCIDELPFPARELFDFKNYLFDSQGTPKFKINEKPSGSIISQRGCPYKCEFCCGRDSEMYHTVKVKTNNGTIWRTHSPNRILEELSYMRNEFGLESFMFYDDEFNLNPEKTLDLCSHLKGKEYNLRGFVKSDLLVKHPEIAIAMKEAGFTEVLTGVESGSERILEKHLHKKTSPEINYRAAEILLDNKMGLKALTMLGHTSETEEDILKTRDWILKVGTKFLNKLGPGYFTFDLTIFQPYAGCLIWDKAEKNTGEFSDDFKWVYKTKNCNKEIDSEYGGIYFNKVDFSTEHGFYKGIPGKYKAFIRTKNVAPERFVKLRDEIEFEIKNKLKMNQFTEPSTEKQFMHSMGQK